MCKVEKYVLKYDSETAFETFDKQEAEDMQKRFNAELNGKQIEIEIHEVAACMAVDELLDVVKDKRGLIELQSQNFKKLKELQDAERQSFFEELNKKDGMLKEQGELVVSYQKKCETLTSILNLPKNRAQRDLFNQMERCKQLESLKKH